jgi:hypothetical protein
MLEKIKKIIEEYKTRLQKDYPKSFDVHLELGNSEKTDETLNYILVNEILIFCDRIMECKEDVELFHILHRSNTDQQSFRLLAYDFAQQHVMLHIKRKMFKNLLFANGNT